MYGMSQKFFYLDYRTVDEFFMTVIWYEMMLTLKGLMEKTRMRLLNDLGGLIQVAFWLLMIVWNKPEKLSAFKREPSASILRTYKKLWISILIRFKEVEKNLKI